MLGRHFYESSLPIWQGCVQEMQQSTVVMGDEWSLLLIERLMKASARRDLNTCTLSCVCRWFPDDLGIPSFARLGELRKLPVADYDGRYDIWVIRAPLSEGCGGPELPEEIIL